MTSNRTVVVVNANVITMADGSASAEAFAVSGDRFIAIGSNAEVSDTAGEDATIIDLSGKTVIPGLIDSHAHLELMAYSWEIAVDCRSPGVRSIEDIVTRLRAKAASTSPGEWILGQGNHFQDAFLDERRYPDKHDLDRVSQDHPVIFRSSYHFNVFNTKALEMLNVTKDTPNAPGGRIEHDPETGELTGRTFDMYDALGAPQAPHEELVRGLDRSQARYLEVGVTAIGDIPLLSGGLAALIELEHRGQLQLRVTAYPKLPTVVSLDQVSNGDLSARLRHVDPRWLKLGGIKLFLDGGMTSSAAALHEPYENQGDYRGELAFSLEELTRLVARISEAGYQVAIHAIGDRALDEALDALTTLAVRDTNIVPPHRIEHAGNLFMTPERIRRFLDHAILPVPQPSFIYTTAPGYRRQLGPVRSKGLMPFRTMLDAGLRLPGNSDALGLTPKQHNPFLGIWASVAREAINGELIDPDEAISVREALWMYTRDAAYAIGMEDELGSIEVGKLADFTVLAADPLTTSIDDLASLAVEETWVGGTRQYTRALQEMRA